MTANTFTGKGKSDLLEIVRLSQIMPLDEAEQLTTAQLQRRLKALQKAESSEPLNKAAAPAPKTRAKAESPETLDKAAAPAPKTRAKAATKPAAPKATAKSPPTAETSAPEKTEVEAKSKRRPKSKSASPSAELVEKPASEAQPTSSSGEINETTNETKPAAVLPVTTTIKPSFRANAGRRKHQTNGLEKNAQSNAAVPEKEVDTAASASAVDVEADTEQAAHHSAISNSDQDTTESGNEVETAGETSSVAGIAENAKHNKHKFENRPISFGEDVSGVLELMPDGYGFLRRDNYLQGPKDIYVPPQFIRRFNLREGDFICGPGRMQRDTDRYQALQFIKTVNGETTDKVFRRVNFDRLTPVYPNQMFKLETLRNELSTRIVDLISPIGKGQRGMIVSPPKAGKTILLQKIANAISINNPETKLIVLLIDERPEEVTDMQRSINGEVVYSTFDKTPENHVKIAELVLARAMRLVEMGQDVVILLDSITRLSRAYNLTINPTGRTLSGGLDPGALYGPKRFFGAARKIENGGSLTIIATALIDTGSRMDEVIFEEFKGTGNMEVYLDRKLSEKRIFPAIDINRSGTRREELLLEQHALDAVWSIRKAFGQLDSGNVTETIINLLLKTQDNRQFISSINVSLSNKGLFDSMRLGQGQGQNGK